MDHGYKEFICFKKTLSKILSFDKLKSTKASLDAISFIFMNTVNRKIFNIL